MLEVVESKCPRCGKPQMAEIRPAETQVLLTCVRPADEKLAAEWDDLHRPDGPNIVWEIQ